jgi:hypothetical protein
MRRTAFSLVSFSVLICRFKASISSRDGKETFLSSRSLSSRQDSSMSRSKGSDSIVFSMGDNARGRKWDPPCGGVAGRLAQSADLTEKINPTSSNARGNLAIAMWASLAA